MDPEKGNERNNGNNKQQIKGNWMNFVATIYSFFKDI